MTVVSPIVLPVTANINETIVWPTVRYRGSEAASGAWPANFYGPDLELSASGTAPTYGAAMTSFVAPAAEGPDFAAGKYLYANDSGADGDPGAGTRDVLSRVAFGFDGAAALRVLGGKNNWTGAAPNYKGWLWYIAADRTLKFIYWDGVAGVSTISSNSLGTSAREVFAHVMIDISEGTAANGSRIYVDGVDDTAGAVDLSGNGDVSNSADMAIGGAVGATVHNDRVAFLDAYFSDTWFAGGATNNTHWDAFAAADYALVAP